MKPIEIIEFAMDTELPIAVWTGKYSYCMKSLVLWWERQFCEYYNFENMPALSIGVHNVIWVRKGRKIVLEMIPKYKIAVYEQ